MNKKNEAKFKELMSRFTTFHNARYCKTELEAERLEFQDEILALIFEEEHIRNAKLTIWDAYNQLESENREKDGIATEELSVLKGECRTFNNLIGAQISGNCGERWVFERLRSLKGKHRILQNVELEEGDNRSEIDMVVITETGDFIIEVKNTKKDVFIDEKGDYYRKGEYSSFDSHLKWKMNNREYLLSEVLEKTLQERGKKANIIKLVVFSNKWIEVRNRCDELITCTLAELPYLIDEYEGNKIYSEEDIDAQADAINCARVTSEYEPEMDMQKFKEDFVRTLVLLESDDEQEADEKVAAIHTETDNLEEEEKEDKAQRILTGVSTAAFVVGAISVVVAAVKTLSQKR